MVKLPEMGKMSLHLIGMNAFQEWIKSEKFI